MTPKQQAAMQQALEALEIMIGYRRNERNPYGVVCDALESLCEALSEPVQEPVAQVHPSHLKPTDDGKPWCREVLLYSGDHNGDLFKGENYRVKLYTAPPAQCTWVGLTDEEVDEWTPEIHTVIRAIEAKLKEKNT